MDGKTLGERAVPLRISAPQKRIEMGRGNYEVYKFDLLIKHVVCSMESFQHAVVVLGVQHPICLPPSLTPPHQPEG